MKPALSVIIPTLDEARSIGATLEAALKLGSGVEVVVVDGGQTTSLLLVGAE